MIFIRQYGSEFVCKRPGTWVHTVIYYNTELNSYNNTTCTLFIMKNFKLHRYSVIPRFGWKGNLEGAN